MLGAPGSIPNTKKRIGTGDGHLRGPQYFYQVFSTEKIKGIEKWAKGSSF
jgi:hypothetical protein